MKNVAVNDEVDLGVDHQPHAVRNLSIERRNMLIVSTRKVDGVWVVVSRFGDEIWWLTGAPTNVPKSMTKLDFCLVPERFRAVTKEMLYRLMTRGRVGRKPNGVASLYRTLSHVCHFLRYATGLGIRYLSEITPLVCSSYIQACLEKQEQRKINSQRDRTDDKPRSPASLYQRLATIEGIHELSQFTNDPMPQHPWPDSSADTISKYGKFRREVGNTTPLMSDEVFTALFQRAWSIVQSAEVILDLRDEMDQLAAEKSDQCKGHVNSLKRRVFGQSGLNVGGLQFAANLLEVRVACYIVIASLSGCRNQELGFIQSNCHYCTDDDLGERFWWMRSISEKTGVGATEWMIPEAAVKALQIMDRWAEPHQEQLRRQIAAYREVDPSDVRIAEAQRHLDAVFVGVDKANEMQVRTLSLTQMNAHLRDFSIACGLNWRLATHQFRRKFANYAARSKFGDLRYLREHFKHWSMDMTLGYARNESQEMLLYSEIENEYNGLKEATVAKWLNKSTALAGGYGKNIVDWRSREEPITLFKSHAHMVRSIAESTSIRSNGHAWCTADDNLCDGNDINPTRCAGDGGGRGCPSAVIGPEHAAIYVGLYNDLKALEDCHDIGDAGRKRVARDLERCRSVLATLGHDPLHPAEE